MSPVERDSSGSEWVGSRIRRRLTIWDPKGLTASHVGVGLWVMGLRLDCVVEQMGWNCKVGSSEES